MPIVIVSDSILCQVQSYQIESALPKPFHNSSSLSKLFLLVLSLVDFSHWELTHPELNQAQKLISNYQDFYAGDDIDVGLTSIFKHRIKLSDCQPFKLRFRKIPHSMFAEVQKHIQQLLDVKSHLVLVRKKDTSLRMGVDYRQLNLVTIKDAYVLPRIDKLLESIGGNA